MCTCSKCLCRCYFVGSAYICNLESRVRKQHIQKMLLIYYRLNSEENVQMVTALILQLIQSIIKLPDDGGDLSAADAEFQKVCL